MSSPFLLLIPQCQIGEGFGHAIRCARIAAFKAHYKLALQKDFSQIIKETIKEIKPSQIIEYQDIDELRMIAKDYPNVIFDRRNYENYISSFSFQKFQRIIALDPPSIVPEEFTFDYIIDFEIVQKKVLEQKIRNIHLPIPLPLMKVERKSDSVFHLLISFGGSDPANFSGFMLDLLEKMALEQNKFANFIHTNNFQVTFLLGIESSLVKSITATSPWIQIKTFSNEALKDLFTANLVLTSYGNTALELLQLGIPQIHLNPSSYHSSLSKQIGIESYERNSQLKAQIQKALIHHLDLSFDQNHLSNYDYEALVHQTKERWEQTLLQFSQRKKLCPLCGKSFHHGHPVLERFIKRTYHRCDLSQQIVLNSIEEPMEYDKNYFFDDYKKQYGSTYLDDFAHIKSMGTERIVKIKKLLPNNLWNNSKPSILDIGCAFGPFLDAANDEDFIPHGLDINQQAIDYIRKELGFLGDTVDLSGENFLGKAQALGPNQFDCISMWYVIEHLENCQDILHQISALLKPGGVFAFSTPSAEGVSARNNFRKFLSQGPKDHVSVWKPKRSKEYLQTFGFELKKIHSTGHHPERFPLVQRFKGLNKPMFYWSKLRNLGDTVELYCVKTKLTEPRDIS
jgi:2-polyprenyl-3-methyl-5-hydroxy-6-metoxy-1,4-benzoquinol methylase/spore coat polysaccharide biosynthesis predicted glycosyltransferase SpsG